MSALWAAQREWTLRHAPLRVTMLDVGQGEAIVIQSPSGRTVLIDGGSSDQPDIGRSVIVPYLQFIGARRLDAIVFTHADSDHCNGIEQVVREMPIGMALDGASAAANGFRFRLSNRKTRFTARECADFSRPRRTKTRFRRRRLADRFSADNTTFARVARQQ